MAQALILVVEDNPAMLAGIQDLLEMAGYRVLVASDAAAGLCLLEDHHPDLILSDIMMPEVDGYQFYEKVRQRREWTDIPFIFLTARGEKTDVRRGKELGADDYITKPFEEEDLLAAVRGKLARWEALKQENEQRLETLKRAILRTLSHEFRTPLTYVINYTEMLDQEGGDLSPEEFRKFMQGIRRGADRLHRLVLDFITLVEIEAGEAERVYLLRRRPIGGLGPWLRTVARGFEAAAQQRGLELVLQVPDDLPTVMADEVFLVDAIGRLLENAVKFSRTTSRQIWLRAGASADWVWIEVEDQGVGIRQQEIASLFDLFHQINRQKQEQQGTGSGLAICKGLVELHGGTVGVRSQAGVGSTFRIELPIVVG
ncbi:MAG: response regulator [Chloroflexota bacterium]